MSILEKPYVITREQVKNYVGITDTSYDTQIDAWIPVVSDDVVLITNNVFVSKQSGDIDGTTAVTNTNADNYFLGSVVSVDDVRDAVVVSRDSTSVTLDKAPSSTASGADIYVNNFPQAKKPIVAQMVMYNISKYAVDMIPGGDYKSENIGSYSYTKSDRDSGTVAGYPRSIIRALAEITRPRFR
jgi:hypothetical protein